MLFPSCAGCFRNHWGGQLLAMLLLALAVTQGLGLLLLTDERNRAVWAALGLATAGRAANVVLLLDDVFEPFVRFERSRNRDTGGVGLGLAIAQTIIQAHGGSIVLRNLPEGGLEAVVRLPSGEA